jgi:hypothetical protein
MCEMSRRFIVLDSPAVRRSSTVFASCSDGSFVSPPLSTFGAITKPVIDWIGRVQAKSAIYYEIN